MIDADGDTTALRHLWRALSLVMPGVFVAGGLWAISHLTWATLGLGVWLFSKAYLKLKLRQVTLADAWEGKVPDGFAHVFRVVGGAYVLAAMFLSVATIVGEGWGWFILAVGFLWLGVLLIFGDRLAPSLAPWWFQ